MNSNPSTTGNTVPAEQRPKMTFRFGNISAAVFAEETKSGTMMNVSIRRSFKDSAGSWKHTQILAPGDLLPAALALTKCYEFIVAAKAEDRD